MNLEEWMRANLTPEVVADNESPELGIRLRELLAEVWAEGWQAASDETPLGFTPGGPDDDVNPYASTKPDDEIDEQRQRHLTPEAFCEWCGEVDLLGRHANGCRFGPGPDEVDYECPRCSHVAPWTDGIDNVPEFWCQHCGAEVPLSDCRVVAR